MGKDDKSTYEKKTEARLRELDAEMELLQAKADKLEVDAQERGRTAIDDLREKRDEVAEQLATYRKSAGSALEEIQRGVEGAVSEFAESIKRASRRFDQE